MEGPRGLKKEELDSLKQLQDICFWKGLVDAFPHLFHEDNFDNIRVIVDKGQVISCVVMTKQGASIFGCKLAVANIGAVCTHPEYRQRGLATRLFGDTCKKAYIDGMDFMLVSGGRSLYLRAGCRPIVGCDYSTTITPEQVSLFSDSGLTIEHCREDDLSSIAAIYRTEPVRFLRRKEDYQRAFACQRAQGRLSDFLMVKKGVSLRAYVILPRPEEKKRAVQIVEYAGERASLVDALGLLIQNYELEKLSIHVMGWDTLLKSLLEEKGLKLLPSNASGTARIVNFPQFMERMRPYFEEIIGVKLARQLHFVEEDGRFCIKCGDGQVVLSRAEAVQLLFGSKEAELEKLLASGGKVHTLLFLALPIPALWYGLNFA
ncbi:MAG: GNAT family N-acetyltransferase [Deltaproteobacteria bacterium]|nr:GNAT family N-acetyltransferase [Deltaproteobacteria bacterium]